MLVKYPDTKVIASILLVCSPFLVFFGFPFIIKGFCFLRVGLRLTGRIDTCPARLHALFYGLLQGNTNLSHYGYFVMFFALSGECRDRGEPLSEDHRGNRDVSQE
jgi:hypothetical protein